MREGEDIERFGGAVLAGFAAGSGRRPLPATVMFTRPELYAILAVYGRKVAAGEWRDYAIDHSGDEAIFSIFRRASEVPIYRVVKQPELARRQGAFAVLAATGQILKRGHELGRVLRFLDPKLSLVGA